MDLQSARWIHTEGWEPRDLGDLDSDRTLVLAFGDSDLLDAPEPLRRLRESMPLSHVIGCSTAGQVVDRTVVDGAPTAIAVRFDRSDLRTARAPVAGVEGSYAAGAALAAQLAAPDLRLAFVLGDGLRVNGSELARALREGLPEEAVITGGLAGDGDRFERTWVIVDGEARSGVVAAVGLYGTGLTIGSGSRGGWTVFGPERRITRSSGNVLFELDGRPALSLYKTYLGDLADGLPASALLFPLSVREHADSDNELLRTILAIDEETHSMTFAGDVPEGSLARLMMGTPARLVAGAAAAAEDATRAGDGATAVLGVAVSCVGRRLVLGDGVSEELSAAMRVLPSGSRQVGFYSYGELAPGGGGFCDLHNQTMTYTAIGERP